MRPYLPRGRPSCALVADRRRRRPARAWRSDREPSAVAKLPINPLVTFDGLVGSCECLGVARVSQDGVRHCSVISLTDDNAGAVRFALEGFMRRADVET